MALNVDQEAGLGSERLQIAMDMLNSVMGQPVGLGGRPNILQNGSPLTFAQIATATGLSAAQVLDLASRRRNG
jgi:hypothetical protein